MLETKLEMLIIIISLFINPLQAAEPSSPMDSVCLVRITKGITKTLSSSEEYCTAHIISPKALLTAGHCYVENYEPRSVQKTIKQEVFCPKTRKWYRAWTKPITHPGYAIQPNHKVNDMAIVRIRDDINDIPPAQLPQNSLETLLLTIRNRCVSVGQISQTSQDASLKTETNPITEFSTPQGIEKVNPKLVASGKAPFDIEKEHYLGEGQQGDSGGPVMCQNFADEWVSLGVVTQIRRNTEDDKLIVAFENLWKNRSFWQPYAQPISSSENLSSESQQSEFRELLKAWDQIWVYETGRLGVLQTPDALDNQLLPIWEKLIRIVKPSK